MGKDKKGKKENKKRRSSNVYKLYDTASGLKRKNKTCPKCGSSVFMAEHKDRSSCGKCEYTEFKSKKE